MKRILSPLFQNNKYPKKRNKIKMKKNALDPVDFEEEKRKDPKYKTELCKTFMQKHICQYGNKCRFAHGENELVTKIQNNNYKKKTCKSFFNLGYCPYGIRCNFQHDQRKLSDVCLPYYYINLIIFHRPKLTTGKRLKIFEEFSTIFSKNNTSNKFDSCQDIIKNDNNLSISTLSNSINNSPNSKNCENFFDHEFFQIDNNIKKLNYDVSFGFDEYDLEFNKDEEEEEGNENEIKDDEKYCAQFCIDNIEDVL